MKDNPASPAGTRTGASGIVIAVLIAVATLNSLSINMIVPALPSMAAGLATDFASVQLTLSSYLFATAIAQLVHGPLSDKFGRRPVLMAGMLLYILASVICLFATSVWIVILGRILQGVGAAAGFALGRAIVRDLYEREKAASMLGYITMGFSLAPMVAPLIGGLISDHLGWRLIFLFLTAVGCVLLFITWTALPETRKPVPEGEKRIGFVISFATLAKIPAFWAYALTTGFMTAVFFAFLGGTPYVATTLFGMSGTEYGLYFVFVPIGFFIGNFFTARLTMRVGSGRLMRIGNLISLAASISSLLLLGSGWQHPLALFAPIYLIGLANGLSSNNSIAGAVSVRPHLAGAASGIAGSFQIGFGAVATVIIGYLLTLTSSPMPVPILMTVLALCAVTTGQWAKVARA
jgi:DHA1 family bicyclomycin/chloramphenicol resistance-like MFS transporter